MMMSYLYALLKRTKQTTSVTEFFFSICYVYCLLCLHNLSRHFRTSSHLLLRSEGDCGFGWILISHSTAWSERASVLAFLPHETLVSLQHRPRGSGPGWTGAASGLQVRCGARRATRVEKLVFLVRNLIVARVKTSTVTTSSPFFRDFILYRQDTSSRFHDGVRHPRATLNCEWHQFAFACFHFSSRKAEC